VLITCPKALVMNEYSHACVSSVSYSGRRVPTSPQQ
jgi:hypothetical protein